MCRRQTAIVGRYVIGLAVQAITAYTAWLSEREIRIDQRADVGFLKEAGLVVE